MKYRIRPKYEWFGAEWQLEKKGWFFWKRVTSGPQRHCELVHQHLTKPVIMLEKPFPRCSMCK